MFALNPLHYIDYVNLFTYVLSTLLNDSKKVILNTLLHCFRSVKLNLSLIKLRLSLKNMTSRLSQYNWCQLRVKNTCVE